jgi:RNA polymerase sigma-70 factor (ECF subfamily)
MEKHLAQQTGSTLLYLLRDPRHPDVWPAFVDRYGPRIYGWCRKWKLQEADAENVTQDVLVRLVQKLPTFTYDPRKGSFRGWLQTLTRHALHDYLESRQRAGVGSGDTKVLEKLESLEARDDLLETLKDTFDQELLDEAKERVRLKVSTRDWQIFHELAFEGRAAAGVAEELGLNASAVLMAKSRVQKKLREEVRSLQGSEAG